MNHSRFRGRRALRFCFPARVLVSASVMGTALTGLARPALGQQLSLSATVGKTVFFEGEPIYGLFELRNNGPDTAWIGIFGLGPDRLRVSLRQADGALLPEARMWTDYAIPPGWRGVPLGPGERRYQLVVLQDVLGTPVQPRWTVFPKHIRPGAYSLVATFNAAVDGVGNGPSDVAAAPLEIEIRPRTPREDRLAQEVERVCGLAWDKHARARYFTSLLTLVETRLADDSSDTFLAFLINDAVMTGRAVGATLGSRDVSRLSAVRLGVARAQKTNPAGAMAALTLFGDAQPHTSVSTLLGVSLAAEVVAEREKAARGRPFIPGRPR